MHILAAVANNDGYEYDGYYPIDGRDMMFGEQSIDVKDGADFILEQIGAAELLTSA